MEPSIIHSKVSEFDERNSFLFFVLGLISLSVNFLQCKGIKDTCRTLIYLPIINLELISDDQFKQAV